MALLTPVTETLVAPAELSMVGSEQLLHVHYLLRLGLVQLGLLHRQRQYIRMKCAVLQTQVESLERLERQLTCFN